MKKAIVTGGVFMWIHVDPEELAHYQCRSSLKKLRGEVKRRYEDFSAKRYPPEHLNTPGSRALLMFHDNLWFTGVSSNPLLSLAAHGVDLADPYSYFCWVIPVQYAAELKAAALELDFFRHISEDASDYIAPEQPYTYLYNYRAEKGAKPLIDTAGFTPLKYLPGRPAQIFQWDREGNRRSRRIETQERDSYPEVVAGLLEKAKAGEIVRLLLRSPEGKIMQCDFRDGGCDLFFDARTSQSGYVYRYLPEEGLEGDWERLSDILLYLLRNNGKLKKTKWKYIKKELASDNMRFSNGMIVDD